MRKMLAVATALAVALTGAAIAAPAAGDVLPLAERERGWDRSQAPQRVLQDGTPEEAGLIANKLAAIEPALTEGLTTEPTPFYPGAVALVAANGVIAERSAVGHAVRWADPDTELPADEHIDMATDTIFDLASLSKLFTAVAVMQLVEQSEIDLEDPAADYIPAFAAEGKDDVTIEHLLTHTGGLPAWINLYSAYDDIESRLAAVYEVAPTSEPGERYVYSDLGLIVLGKIVERVSSMALDEYVDAHITGPLGMT